MGKRIWYEIVIASLSLGVGLFLAIIVGCESRVPQLVVHDQRTIIHALESDHEKPAQNEVPRIHGTPTFDDPTVVVFKNTTGEWGASTTFKVRIDDGEPITVLPGQASVNQYLPFGQHKVVTQGWIETGVFGRKELPARVFSVDIRPRGRAQIINLH